MSDKKQIKTALKEMFEREQLSDQEIQQLMPKRRNAFWHTWSLPTRWTFAGMSTAIVCLLILNLTFTQHFNTTDETYQRIAAEVMTNHLHMKLLDVETDSMSELQIQLENLNFIPQYSQLVKDKQITLLGGRYCTLQGLVATQLHFKTVSGELMTQYQTVYEPKLFGALPDISKGEKPMAIYQRGFEMQLWQESGLLMITAKRAA